MKADILQILHEEATTQYNPNGKDERVVNSDEFDTVANQIINLYADKKYTEEDVRKAIKLSRETESVRRGALSEDWDDVEKYDERDIIYLLNKQD